MYQIKLYKLPDCTSVVIPFPKTRQNSVVLFVYEDTLFQE